MKSGVCYQVHSFLCAGNHARTTAHFEKLEHHKENPTSSSRKEFRCVSPVVWTSPGVAWKQEEKELQTSLYVIHALRGGIDQMAWRRAMQIFVRHLLGGKQWKF